MQLHPLLRFSGNCFYILESDYHVAVRYNELFEKEYKYIDIKFVDELPSISDSIAIVLSKTNVYYDDEYTNSISYIAIMEKTSEQAVISPNPNNMNDYLSMGGSITNEFSKLYKDRSYVDIF